jgi:hypothetical protein
MEKFADEIVSITDRFVALELRQLKITEESEINVVRAVFEF